MDLVLDGKQNEKFKCETCDPNLQVQRNCGGRFGKKAKSIMVVNDRKYESCPRSLTLGKFELGLMVSTYLECRDSKKLPYGTNVLDQTAYCKEVFDFLDGMVQKHQDKKQKEHEREMEKMKKKNESPKKPTRKR